MAASSSQDSDDEIVGINVTPLVDIVLVLLIIFMVTANFIVRDTFEGDLPRAAHGGETVQGLLNVVVEKDGTLVVDGTALSEDELVAKVGEALRQDPETRAIVMGDQGIGYGRVMRVVDLIKGAGLAKFAFAVQKPAEAAAP